jgi:GT2 family glycosyltransferase
VDDHCDHQGAQGMSDRRCLVAICHNGPVIFTETAQSLMELGWGNRVQEAKDAHGFVAIDFTWSRAFPRVDSLRDHVAARALQHPAGYTHILFLDADMVWPTDVLLRMLAHHDKGIVSGLYHLKGGDYAPVAMGDGKTVEGMGDLIVYTHDRDYQETGAELRPQQVVGMGCALVPMAVFRALGQRPWFQYEYDDQGWPAVSEDVPFCRKAREAGFPIWLDPMVKCGHVTTNTVTEKWHRAATEGMVAALMQAAVQ